MRSSVFAVAIITAGCAPGNPLPPMAMTPAIESAAAAAVRSQLRDPDSAQFERLTAGSDKDGSAVVCGYVNAKNGFGGYSGRKLFAVRVAPNGSATVEALKDEAYALGWCHRHKLIPA